MSDDGPEWFAPKQFGFGSGLPIAWQGWAVLSVYLAVVLIPLWLLKPRPLAILGIVVPATIILLVITVRTTRGGWRWRWGDPD